MTSPSWPWPMPSPCRWWACSSGSFSSACLSPPSSSGGMPSRFSGEVLRSVLTTRADRKTGASSAGQVIIYGGSGAGRRRAGGQGAPERLAGLGITEAGAEWLVRVAGARLLAGLRLLFLDRLGRHQHGHAFDVGVADLHRKFSWLNRGRRVTQRD